MNGLRRASALTLAEVCLAMPEPVAGAGVSPPDLIVWTETW